MIVRPALLVMAVVGCLATGSATASAATVVTSNPGSVNVMAGPENNDITVQDSLRDKNIAPIKLGAMLAARPLAEEILIRVESIALEDGPSSLGRISIAVGGFLAVMLRADELDNDLEADGALTITDHSGAPIRTAPPCRHVLRNESDPSTPLVNSVKCSLLPGADDGLFPRLVVMAGSGDDHVLLSLACQLCLTERIVAGEEGRDTLWGSVFADDIDGGAGNDIIRGRDSDDALTGGVDGDMLFGGGGSDTAHGGLGNDLVSGGPGSDVSMATPEGAALSGGSGDDVVIGGRGLDTMTGSLGRDMLLSKESDFGTRDELDPVVNCGPDGPSEKFVRSSPGDGMVPPDKLYDCPDGQYPHEVGAMLLRSISLNDPWPWLAAP